MERFIILLSKGAGFTPCVASVTSAGGPAFPPNSQSFARESEMLAAFERAGIPRHALFFATRALADGANTWIEVDEQQARLFASGYYEII